MTPTLQRGALLFLFFLSPLSTFLANTLELLSVTVKRKQSKRERTEGKKGEGERGSKAEEDDAETQSAGVLVASSPVLLIQRGRGRGESKEGEWRHRRSAPAARGRRRPVE
jgi:hypothetical protein